MDNHELNQKKQTGFWGFVNRLFKPKQHPSDKDYKTFFFKHAWLISWALFILGLASAVIIFMVTGDPFKTAAVIFLLIWLVVFLRYFLWAVYHYNVNYGLTIQDWENIKNAKERLKNGESVLQKELEEPKYNPYRSQTFGVPPGTVRGMLAFTLLFGAISILIASMGMDQVDLENTLIRDQFEFFKTAFLMMMAFYFGDKSLRFLQTRWKDPNKTTVITKSEPSHPEEVAPTSAKKIFRQKSYAAAPGMPKYTSLTGALKNDDDFHVEDEASFADAEGLTHDPVAMTDLKNSLNTFTLASPSELTVQSSDLETIDELADDGQMSCNHPCTPIIDAGHGGIIDGKYSTGNKKRYQFKGTEKEFEILEGVINRGIANKLIEKLEENGLPYYSLNVEEQSDLPLSERVAESNRIYSKDRSSYLLSIHSNAASPSLQGKGSKAKGFEVWTSVGETPSDQLARIAKREYQKSFGGRFRFRGVKEKNLYVLKNTRCPAMLVENLFFDNYEEALYLMSEEGQNEIAECLLNVVKSIHYYYED